MSVLFIDDHQTNQIILENNGNPDPLNELHVTQTGSLTVGNTAIGVKLDASLVTVDGSVFSHEEAIKVSATANAMIMVGATGFVRGLSGIYVGLGSHTIVNSGEIAGSSAPTTAAIKLDGSDKYILNGGLLSGYYGILGGSAFGQANQNQIVNDGAIQAIQTGIALFSSAGFAPSADKALLPPDRYGVWNSGTINAGYSGIEVQGLANVSNSGTIQASTYGIRFFFDVTKLVNSGTIIAKTAVAGGTGDDTIINDGRLEGAVLLGQGNDLYDGHKGVVTGLVDLGQGNDTAQGGSGTDSLSGGVGNDMLSGNGGEDVLNGGTGLDTLDGGSGADQMAGGLGDDLYVVDNAGDIVTEHADEGTDTVLSSISFTLSQNVERLTLTGTAAIDGTGNDLANIIQGNAAANVLDGGAGADALSGGGGNDTYVVDDAGDVVSEKAGEGTDTVLASVGYALTADVENLVLTGAADIDGTGNALSNRIVGNAGNNVLDGGAGADLLTGGEGDDTYIVDHAGDVAIEQAGEGSDTVRTSVSFVLGAHVENLVLTGAANIDGMGNGLANVLTGNDGDNILDGGAGADALAGGLGNDTYVVDDAGDVVVEAAGQGTDTVWASISYALGDEVENLSLAGTGDLAGTGNGLANTILGNGGGNVLRGNGGDDLIDGGGGIDKALFSGQMADYDIVRKADGSVEIHDRQDGRDGTDVLRGIEFLQFADLTVALPSSAPGAPVVQGTVNAIDENAERFTPIATLRTPGFATGEATYSLVTNPGNKFAIDATTGAITLVGDVDYEATAAADPDLKTEFADTPQERKYYLLQVGATETVSGWASAPTTVKVYVSDVNEAPTSLSFTTGTTKATIGESAVDGAVVGTFQALDPEGDSQFVYAFDTSGSGGSSGAGNAGGRFKIEDGQLKVAALSDITKTETYTVTVKVTDKNGGPGAASAYKDFLITVNPATGGNAEPVFGVTGNPATQAVDNGSAVKPFAGVTLSDADDDTLTLTLSFTNADGALGNIFSTGTVTVEDPNPTATTRVITLTGKAGDLQTFLDGVTFDPTDKAANSGQFTTQFSFTVKDDSHAESAHANAIQVVTTIADKSMNEAPDTIRLNGATAVSLAENTPTGTEVGALTAHDPEGKAITYALSDSADARFKLDATGTKILVADGARLDYEAATFHDIKVIATDADGLSSEQVIRVNLSNVDETPPPVPTNHAPSGLTLSGVKAAAEYAVAGTEVGSLSAADADSDALTYTLLDNAGGRFMLSGNRILVADGFKLDFEQATAHTVTVQVNDGHGGVAQQSFAIGVTDVVRELTGGSTADDVFKAGKAHDKLYGNAGNDKLYGAAGNDTLKGDAGNDVLWGGAGKDVLFGGKGKDVFVFDTKFNKKTNLDKIGDFNVKDDTLWLDNALFKSNKKLYAAIKKGTEAKPLKMASKFFKLDKAKDKDDFFIYDKKKGILYYDSDGSGSHKAVEIAMLKKNLKMTYKDFFFI